MIQITRAIVFFLAWVGGCAAYAQDVFTNSDLQDAITTAVGCDLSTRLKAQMTAQPVFRLGESGCEAVVPPVSGTYYIDAACETAFDYAATGQQQFCREATDKATLGEAGSDVDQRWTLSPGATYDIGALSLEGLSQPYRRTVLYRTVATAQGECQLLMRIYKNDLKPVAPLQTMLALHGGSWRNRGFGAFGIESSAAHYTNQGFVVFAPFYRLLGSSEGSAGCNNATLAEITDDVDAALQWVQQNAGQYGATGKPVVLGQSAGAHLALNLAVNGAEQIAAAVLLYPPTDFTDFLQQMRAGEYTNSQGIGLMDLLLGNALQFDPSQSPVPENSFPEIVQRNNSAYPPMQILHGVADDLVPARQSIRLCNALAGRALDSDVQITEELQLQVPCGSQSTLTLFKEGKHALDVCLSGDPLFAASCFSGSRQSKRLVAAQIERTASWAAIRAQATMQSSGGGGSVFYLLLFFVFIKRGMLRC